ncbi:hypothetical protein BsWGS_15601 [Bradybaena similaris]
MPTQGDETAADNVNGTWESWDVNEVERKMRENKLSDNIVKAFVGAGIKGRHFKQLYFSNLMSDLKLRYSDCLEVKNFFVEVGCWPAPFVGNLKIFNDPIHGNIRLNPVCLAVIDTPQFQRLRYIKQTGLCYFVYPGAAHNRFEHSLGVCYLAGQFIRTVKGNQPELGIDENDVLCLELAGLCHDLGHGPFSHVFDAKFIPQVVDKPWKHEIASRDMFAHIVQEHGLMEEDGIFRKSGLTETDMDFIKELMAGPSNRGNAEWPYKGREKAKAYLYEIVANKRNCIDVDKWDYIARDCHQLGIRNNFDYTRFIKFARVIEVNGEMQICMRDKELVNLYNMFSTRYLLHKNAYQHKVNCALDIMIEQALINADKHVHMIGKDGKRCAISECIDDMEAYTHLTDNIIHKILDTELPENASQKDREELEKAKSLIQRIFSRKLFKCIYESQPLQSEILEGESEEMIKKEITEICSLIDTSRDDFSVKIIEKATKLKITYKKDKSICIKKDHAFDKMQEGEIQQKIIKEWELVTKLAAENMDDFFVKITDLDFGMKDENPVEKLNVYSKQKPDAARHVSKEETSRILAPYTFKEQLVRIYIYDRSLKMSDGLNIAWHIWFDKRYNLRNPPAEPAPEQQSAQPKH